MVVVAATPASKALPTKRNWLQSLWVERLCIGLSKRSTQNWNEKQMHHMFSTHVTFQIHLKMGFVAKCIYHYEIDTAPLWCHNFAHFFPDQVGCDKDPKIVIIVIAVIQRDKQLIQKKENQYGNFRVVCSALCDDALKSKSSSLLSKSNVWNWMKQVHVNTRFFSVHAPPDKEVVEINSGKVWSPFVIQSHGPFE